MRLRNASAAAVCALVLASALVGQSAPTPAPTPAPIRQPRKVRSSKPPLDFSGIWVLDEKASQNVSNKMSGAVLSVKQNGHQIWIEPIEQRKALLLSEQIVVDGRMYEKAMGKQKTTFQADWGKDGESLWLQVRTGNEENPDRPLQRSVWRLRDFGNTWTRQTWTISGDKSRQSFFVFRKRSPAAAGTPSPAPRPTPARKP